MNCGNHHTGDVEHIDDSDFVAAWDSLRAWREANLVDRNEVEKVRAAVRDRLHPILPPPRDTSSQWWLMLCALSGDLLVWQTLAETKWIVWAYWGAIPPDARRGTQPVPGEDFDL